MTAFQILGLLLTLSAAFAYVNFRWIRLPTAIGLMAMALSASVALIVVDGVGWLHLKGPVTVVLDRISFGETLLHGLLGALLFAGSLHIDLAQMRKELGAIVVLAIVSTLLSTFAIGALLYVVLGAVAIPLPLGHCLLFGAIIAPTDPVGVLGILKAARIPKSLEIQIAGESLFNDGVGVVVFVAISGIVTHHETLSVSAIATAFVHEALGGIAFGLVTGYVAYRLLKSIDHYQTELLITLALVVGGYAAAEHLGISAPLASVASGLLIGNQGRARAMSDVTRDHLDKFWMLVDEILNTILFVLVGFELIRLSLSSSAILAGVLAVPISLVCRLGSVALPIALLRRWIAFVPGAVAVLTWGGLRGGISVALALALAPSPERNVVVVMTYSVVVFSVLVQGLTLGKVARRFVGNAAST
ncbi:MAG: sodium:proton antiporter [Polyangiaceae bacterium]